MGTIKLQNEQNDNKLLLVILLIFAGLFFLTIGFRSTDLSVDSLLKKHAIVQNVHLNTSAMQYNDIAILFSFGHFDFSNEKMLVDKKRVPKNSGYFESTLSFQKKLKHSRFIEFFCHSNQYVISKLSVVLII